MVSIPAQPADKGYFDISRYSLDSLSFLDATLTLRFLHSGNGQEGFVVQLSNVVAYNTARLEGSFAFLRVDGDGSSYGWDIAVRLKQEKLKDYMVLYLFEDVRHTKVAFRGLAERINITPL